MQLDRAAAMEYLRRPGEVYRSGDVYYITSREAVRYAQSRTACAPRCAPTSMRSRRRASAR